MVRKLFNMEWRSPGVGAALIIVLTVLAYLPAMRGGFIFDDTALITDNRMVKASDGLYRFWLTKEAVDYWPLTTTTWWLEWRWWGNRATGYHVVNLLLHAINAVLVWMILRRLKIPGAWLAAVVFAIHPVNVATVAWISEQKNTLSMLFYAAAILLYLRFDEEGRWRWYGLSLAAFLLALLSKTAVVMLPVVLLGCMWWTHGKVRWKDFLRSVPFFVLAVALGLLTIWFQYNRTMEGHAIRTEGFAARLAAAGCVPWFYLSKALLPVDLTVIYRKWEIDPTRWVSYAPGIISIGGLVVFWWRRKTWGRPLLFGLGYFVVMLFPVLGFFDQGFYQFSFVADHWQYYSIVGVIALIVAAWQRISRPMDERGWSVGGLAPQWSLRLASAAVLMALGVATWKRSGVYASEETLWRDNVTKNPAAWAAHNNLGWALELRGKPDDAIRCYEQALRLNPNLPHSHNNLGNALRRTGRYEDAIRHLERAVRLKPDYVDAHVNLGLALSDAGKIQEAIRHYEQALRLKPDYAEAHYNLGSALMRLGRPQEAIPHFEQALRLKPDYVEAHANLGVALQRTGKLPEAILHYEQALRLKPESAEVHNDLGVALQQTGKLPEAILHYEQTLRLKPDSADAHSNLGVALQQTGKLPEAIGQYEQAVQLKPNSADAHNKLGNALLQAGKLKAAIQQYEQALRIAPDLVEAQNNLAWLLATLAPAEGGDPVRAVALAQRVCEQTGNRMATYLDTLAVAYAAAGQFADAIATAQRAIESARSAGQTALVKEIESRLQLYRRGRAYHPPVDVISPHNHE